MGHFAEKPRYKKVKKGVERLNMVIREAMLGHMDRLM
jgi:hypothetical protein